MKNTRTILLLAFALFALIFSILTVVFWSFMADTILLPIYYILWVAGLVINSVPQGIYLGLLILLSIVIGLRTLGSLRYARSYHAGGYDEPNPSTRYQHWRTLCDYTHGTWFSRNRLASESRDLLLSILAFEQGVDRLQAEQMVRRGDLDIPEVLREVIVSKHILDAPSSSPPAILSWLPLPARWRDTSHDLDTDLFLIALINFVEHHLEITPHARNEFES